MTHLFVNSFPPYTQMVFAEIGIGDGLLERQGSSESLVTVSPMGENVHLLMQEKDLHIVMEIDIALEISKM